MDHDYDNGDKIRFVGITVYLDPSDVVEFKIGATSPSTRVAYLYNYVDDGGMYLQIFAVIPPGWEYRLNDSSGSPSLIEWHEWDLH
jgi:hypothetical protein